MIPRLLGKITNHLKMKKSIFAAFTFMALLQMGASGQNRWVAEGVEKAVPEGTYLFMERDSAGLYMDYYPATEGSATEIDGHAKPALIFAFGGGFTGGNRDKPHYQQWIKVLNDNGYPVFSIDYRLGLKGVHVKPVKMIGAVRNAIRVGVEDMYAATAFIVRNAGEFGISPDNLVISGSSAGAIIALQSEYELCNGSELASGLPDGFSYAGVISFSGAIFSSRGKVKYAEMPAPQMLLHGTADKVVTYKSIRLFRLGLFGSSKLARRLDRAGSPYTIVRYSGHGHDIADLMYYTLPEQLVFLEESVVRKTGRTADIHMDDPSVPVDNSLRNLKDLYN